MIQIIQSFACPDQPHFLLAHLSTHLHWHCNVHWLVTTPLSQFFLLVILATSWLRFDSLRKARVSDSVLAPGRKGRHERVDMAHLIKRSEENYVDFQQARHLSVWKANNSRDQLVSYFVICHYRRIIDIIDIPIRSILIWKLCVFATLISIDMFKFLCFRFFPMFITK